MSGGVHKVPLSWAFVRTQSGRSSRIQHNPAKMLDEFLDESSIRVPVGELPAAPAVGPATVDPLPRSADGKPRPSPVIDKVISSVGCRATGVKGPATRVGARTRSAADSHSRAVDAGVGSAHWGESRPGRGVVASHGHVGACRSIEPRRSVGNLSCPRARRRRQRRARDAPCPRRRGDRCAQRSWSAAPS